MPHPAEPDHDSPSRIPASAIAPPEPRLQTENNRNYMIYCTTCPRLALIAVCAALITLAPRPAAAQSAVTPPAQKSDIYVTENRTISTDVGGCDVIVGKDATGKTLPGTVTLTVASGAVVVPHSVSFFASTSGGGRMTSTTREPSIPARDAGLLSFGSSHADITGGFVTKADGRDGSTTTVSGGEVVFLDSRDASRATISGGVVTLACVYDASHLTISGGSLWRVAAGDASRLTVAGGSVSIGLQVIGSATADFVGTGLTYSYTGYKRDELSDHFLVSGTFNGAHQSYLLRVTDAPANAKANPKPRRFTFNGKAPVAAP